MRGWFVQAQFCFLPALANSRWRALHSASQNIRSLITQEKEMSASQPLLLLSDARLRLCWVLALFAVLVRESFQLSRTVGHSPYRMKPSKSALCKHSSFFRFHTALLIAYAHYNIFSACFYWIGGWLWENYWFFIQGCGLICCNKFTLVILCFFWYTNVIMLGENPQL